MANTNQIGYSNSTSYTFCHPNGYSVHIIHFNYIYLFLISLINRYKLYKKIQNFIDII